MLNVEPCSLYVLWKMLDVEPCLRVYSRFYLAFALSLREGGAGTRAEEVINLLQDTMESLLVKNSEEAVSEEASRSVVTSIWGS